MICIEATILLYNDCRVNVSFVLLVIRQLLNADLSLNLSGYQIETSISKLSASLSYDVYVFYSLPNCLMPVFGTLSLI